MKDMRELFGAARKNVPGLNDAAYRPRYSTHKGADLQQFTSNGTCPGIPGRVDLNRITGQGKKEHWFRKAGKCD